MRLSYCYPSPQRIREGVRRLVGVIDEEMELRETFGSSMPTLRRGYEAPNTDLT
jgi:2-aminoadipate transaminase